MKRIFISYVRENEEKVDRLYKDLKSRGLKVWLDKENILGGRDWKAEVRRAIQDGDFFIACFSKEYYDRDRTFMLDEVTTAIDKLRERHHTQSWFIPVKLDDSGIPDIDIGAGKTLQNLQYISLNEDWEVGIQKLLKSIRSESEPNPLKLFIVYAHKDLEAKDELITRLGPLKNEGLISSWHDNEILSGDKWRDDISNNVGDSDILLYLASASSLASVNCNMTLGIVLGENVRPIPIILEACEWPNHQLSGLQVFPKKGKPINESRPEDKSWQGVEEGIRKIINEMHSQADELSGTPEKELRAELAFQRGNVLVMLRQIDRAVSTYSDAIKLKPDHAAAYNNRGIAHTFKRELDQAITDYSKAIVLEELEPELARAHNNRGNTYQNKGQVDKAIEDYTEAVKLTPRNARAYFNLGTAYSDKNQFDMAIVNYDEAISLKKDYAEAHANRGNAKSDLGKYEDALADYDEAIRLKSNYAEAYHRRGNVKSLLKRHKAAIADYDEAIRLRPDFAEYYNKRGFARRILRQYEKALADYDKAISLKPDYAEAYYGRAGLKNERRKESALADYDEAIRLKPDYAGAYNDRGNLKSSLGQYEEAMTDFTEAIRLRPDDVNAYTNRALLNLELHRVDEARADSERALELADQLADQKRGDIIKAMIAEWWVVIPANKAIRIETDPEATDEEDETDEDN